MRLNVVFIVATILLIIVLFNVEADSRRCRNNRRRSWCQKMQQHKQCGLRFVQAHCRRACGMCTRCSDDFSLKSCKKLSLRGKCKSLLGQIGCRQTCGRCNA